MAVSTPDGMRSDVEGCAELPNMSQLSDMCEIEASVCSGLEPMAKEELEEKLGGEATICRGRANIHVSVSQVKKALDLRGVDNLMVVAGRFSKFQFSDNLPEALDQIRSFVANVDWKNALAVWSQFFNFPSPISHLPPAELQPFIVSLSKVKVTESVSSTSEQTDKAETTVANGESVKCGKSASKRPKKPNLPSFRATCYRTGEKHCFTSPQAAATFGGAIDDYFGWNVDLENFDIEVVLCIDDDDIRVCLTLTKESLHRRDIVKFGSTTLRPTIAHGMLRLCKIQKDEVVCDPMCGGGSIPIEAAISWPTARHICGDVSDQCTSRTRNNVRALNDKLSSKHLLPVHIDVIQWSVISLPLKDQSVDVFITDMPFGKRSGSKQSNWQLYPQVLREMARVCKLNTGRACLLTHDRKCMAKSLQLVSSLWRRGPTVGVNIGGLASCIYLLYRTSATLSSSKVSSSSAQPKQCADTSNSS